MINIQNVRLFCVGLFIVDGYYDVYVWEGWMPEDDDDVRTGSGRQRWDKDRRLAMETALNYAKGLFLNNLCIICFSTGVDCHLHGKTRQLTVWANGKRNSGLAKFRRAVAPFTQISHI